MTTPRRDDPHRRIFHRYLFFSKTLYKHTTQKGGLCFILKCVFQSIIRARIIFNLLMKLAPISITDSSVGYSTNFTASKKVSICQSMYSMISALTTASIVTSCITVPYWLELPFVVSKISIVKLA